MMQASLLLAAVSALSPVPTVGTTGASVLQKARQSFVENKGQWDKSVLYRAESPGLDVLVRRDGVTLDAYQSRALPSATLDHAVPKFERNSQQVRIQFVGSSPRARVEGDSPLAGKFNYLLGGDKSKQFSNVTRYAKSRIVDLYPGVDAVFYYDGSHPRYDLVVKPGADPSKIRVKYIGANSVKALADGRIELSTKVGKVYDRDLKVFQEHKPVKATRVALGRNEFGFKLGTYDRSKPIVIDPQLWVSYFGGGDTDVLGCIKIDSSGNLIVGGATRSGNLATPNALTNRGDSILAKLTPDGTQLLWCTYLPFGSFSMTLDASGNPLLVGSTVYAGMATPGAYQTALAGDEDAFVWKVSADGCAVIWGTYFGSAAQTSEDSTPETTGDSIVVDKDGHIDICGRTSAGGLATAGAFQEKCNAWGNIRFNGAWDGYIAQLSPDGRSLVWCSYFGGDTFDEVRGLCMNASGEITFVGGTCSSGMATPGAWETSLYAGGLYSNNIFGKVSEDGSRLLWASYYEGDNTGIDSMATDPVGAVYVGAHRVFSAVEVVLEKFSTDGSTRLWSLPVGLSFPDSGFYSLTTDSSGNLYAAGNARLPGLATSDALQVAYGGAGDGYAMKVSSSGTKLWASYLGGSGGDGLCSVAVDAAGSVYVAGQTYSAGLATSGAWLETYAGGDEYGRGGDGIVARILGGTPKSGVITCDNVSGVPGGTVPLRATLTSGGSVLSGKTITFSVAGVSAGTATTGANGVAAYNFSIPATANQGDVTYSASFAGDAITTAASGTGTLSVVPVTSFTVSFPTSTVASGSTVTGTVTLDGTAPTGGFLVALGSMNKTALTVPASLTVPAGSTSATFTATALTASKLTSVQVNVAKSGFTTASTTISVIPPPLTGFTISQTTIVGGAHLVGTLTIGVAAPTGGVVVNLSSSNTNRATVPATVTIPSGATSTTFNIQTLPVATTGSVAISANTDSTAVLKAQFNTTASPVTMSTLTASPSTINAGATSTGTLTLTGPAPQDGYTVTLTSSLPTYFKVPATITVPEGSTSVDFTITAPALAASSSGYITASRTATASKLVTINTVGLKLTSVTASPTTIVGGSACTGTVNISVPAPAGGYVVNLVSSLPSYFGVPASVTIPEGSTSANFTITVPAVAYNASGYITASHSGSPSVLVVLKVTAPTLVSVTASPNPVVGGQTCTGTVTISSVAPAAGYVVNLTGTASSLIGVPASVTIPGGATSVTFAITTPVVTAKSSGYVTAAHSGSSSVLVVITINKP